MSKQLFVCLFHFQIEMHLLRAIIDLLVSRTRSITKNETSTEAEQVDVMQEIRNIDVNVESTDDLITALTSSLVDIHLNTVDVEPTPGKTHHSYFHSCLVDDETICDIQTIQQALEIILFCGIYPELGLKIDLSTRMGSKSNTLLKISKLLPRTRRTNESKLAFLESIVKKLYEIATDGSKTYSIVRAFIHQKYAIDLYAFLFYLSTTSPPPSNQQWTLNIETWFKRFLLSSFLFYYR